jgi:hypothetical protein
MFENRIKNHIVKRKIKEKQNFLNFIIWNIVFFSFFSFVSASVASFVDETYKSQEDLYDAFLNTFFPIFFVILLNVSGKSGSIKNVLLPVLDDVLYNMITWMIPLIVSFSYDDLMNIKTFSVINMCLHVICAVYSLIKWKKIVDVERGYFIFYFLMTFPVVVIPIFWIIIITTRHVYSPIFIIFLTLFGICLVSLISNKIGTKYEAFFMRILGIMVYRKMAYINYIMCFYVPNILQTLLIVLSWPINFYFVKACVFILVLSLTRNVSYFTDKVPGDFLATSTTITQCKIKAYIESKYWYEIFKESQITIDEMYEIQEKMQTKVDKMQMKIETMQTTIDETHKSMNEMKMLMDEIKNNQTKG